MPTSVSAERILTPNHGIVFRLFLDKINLLIRGIIFSSFTRVFRQLKIGSHVQGCFVRKRVAGFV